MLWRKHFHVLEKTIKTEKNEHNGYIKWKSTRPAAEGPVQTVPTKASEGEMCGCLCVFVVDTDWQDEGRPGANQLCEVREGGACSSLPAAGSFVVGVPMFLLTLDGAVRGVPAAVIHGLLFTVVTLKTTNTTLLLANILWSLASYHS